MLMNKLHALLKQGVKLNLSVEADGDYIRVNLLPVRAKNTAGIQLVPKSVKALPETLQAGGMNFLLSYLDSAADLNASLDQAQAEIDAAAAEAKAAAATASAKKKPATGGYSKPGATKPAPSLSVQDEEGGDSDEVAGKAGGHDGGQPADDACTVSTATTADSESSCGDSAGGFNFM